MREPVEARAAATPARGWLRRIGWLVLIWAVSVAVVMVVAAVLRVVMRSVGLAP
ncbi:DUF2474 family protein [Aromatoleum aromaticum]|uniref:DUF2474 family protein n=1 Tax=Aromatoleum aromaticum TaxID=551760 RepID=UPI00031C81AB|nr:DUF2474 family protein [Aromatoleum aromaticum]NMG54585.1 DUF2474 family protein [Aromatoleum aromaticum]